MDNAQKLLEAIHKALPDVIYVYNVLEGKHSYSSRTMVDEYGELEKEYVEGTNESISYIVHPDDMPAVLKNLENLKSMKDDDVLHFRCRSKTGSGEFQWTDTSQVVFSRTETGEVKEVLGITRNVHKQVVEKLALEKSQSIAKVAHWTYYMDTQTIRASDEFFAIKEIENINNTTTLAQAMDLDSNDNFMERMKPVYEKAVKGEPVEHRSVYITPSGKTKHLVSKVVEVTFDEKGVPFSAFGIIQDVTDMVEKENRILRKTEMLENYSFLTSHKLRAPLTNLMALEKELEEELPELANSKLFSHVREELDKLDSIVHELNQIVSVNITTKPGQQERLEAVKKLMIVDDDAVTNFVGKRMLTKLLPGVEVVDYTSPVDAFNNLEVFNPDLIFLDLNMPGWTGWDFMDNMVNKGLNIPVVIVTSSIDFKDKQRAFDYPMIKNFITKPLNKEVVKKILKIEA